MVIDKIALTLAIIGALNWGSVGLFGFDCVAFLFGGQTGMLSRVIYTLVGLAGIWCITMLFREKEPMESGGQAQKIKGEGLALSFYFALKIFFTAPQSLPHLPARALSGGTGDRM